MTTENHQSEEIISTLTRENLIVLAINQQAQLERQSREIKILREQLQRVRGDANYNRDQARQALNYVAMMEKAVGIFDLSEGVATDDPDLRVEWYLLLRSMIINFPRVKWVNAADHDSLLSNQF